MCISGGTGGTVHVTLCFLKDQLLYDIRNLAYVESDVMGEENQHASHVTADIGEEGNVDRVSRILSLVHAEAVELLYPFTKQAVAEESVDDVLEVYTPDEYVIELDVPSSMSRTTIRLLSRQIHEFMVCRVLADWLSITNPQSSGVWLEKARAAEDEIVKAKSVHRGVFTRKLHPW